MVGKGMQGKVIIDRILQFDLLPLVTLVLQYPSLWVSVLTS